MAQGRSTEIITMIKRIRTSRLSIKELSLSIRVPRSFDNAFTWFPTVCLCLGTCGDPRGVGVSYERGTLVVGPGEGSEDLGVHNAQRVHNLYHMRAQVAPPFSAPPRGGGVGVWCGRCVVRLPATVVSPLM